ncbi:MAG: hypothetical protein A2V90_09205 [Gammaproteobacteria bacterium RBG_16_57_12]|nr:MAG: hypothetical protein A2V90_09205 [Gammaproteobacteria bacterium RBG_16_57_12]
MKIKIKQHIATPSPASVDKLENLIILLPTKLPDHGWATLPYGKILKARVEHRRLDKLDEPLSTELPNVLGTRVGLTCIGENISSFDLLERARKLAAPILTGNPGAVSIWCAHLDPELQAWVVDAFISALLAGDYQLPAYKSDAGPARRLGIIDLYGVEKKVNLDRTVAQAQANNLVRRLTALPPNYLTPSHYCQEAAQLAGTHGWKTHFYDIRQLTRLKAGAFLAVARGSPRRDAGILHLHYTPSRAAKAKRPLALVGKGICFDTGGTNLKPARSMHGMHEDMAGSAVALGTLQALSELGADFPIDCWLALAENHIGPEAYRQNEVVTASNGTTIEVIHTDAEGRMVLADTLALASKAKPGLILDFATLTGSCVQALSSRYAGAFTNRDEYIPRIIAAGKASGERVWPFPLDADFDQELKSAIADIKQCTLENEADHILASRFLSRFVGDIPWIHIDLASSSHKGGLAHIPTDTTGFGIRFSLELLLSGDLP